MTAPRRYTPASAAPHTVEGVGGIIDWLVETVVTPATPIVQTAVETAVRDKLNVPAPVPTVGIPSGEFTPGQVSPFPGIPVEKAWYEKLADYAKENPVQTTVYTAAGAFLIYKIVKKLKGRRVYRRRR